LLARLAGWLLGGLFALVLMTGPALADTRVALVIANSAYQHAPRLPNPPNDARSIAAALRQVGFQTTEKNDLSKSDLEQALKVFAQSARGADVAVIYYAGHGMEQGGLNYLVPIDATLASDQDVAFDAIPLDLLLRTVEGASRLKLVILDACRNNPFTTAMQRSGGGTRAIGRGLARVEPDGDVLVAYAAREGSTADDGDGGDSPFTKALTERMVIPGLEIRLLFGQVRDQVLKVTDRRQEPAIYGSLGGDPFYFVPPAAAAPARRAGGPAAAVMPPASPLAQLRDAALADRQAGNLDKAIAEYQAVLAQDPGDTESRLGVALVHVSRSEWDAAIADTDALIKLRPEHAPAWHTRGRAKAGKGDYTGAIADATQAIKLTPKVDNFYVARARYYRALNQLDLAVTDVTTALGISEDADSYYLRGQLREDTGDKPGALADYDKAVMLAPKNQRAVAAKARLARGG